MTHTITSLTVRNYKGINGEITLHPEGKSLVVIAGANGSGKSSFVDAISEIFDPKGTKLTRTPIHEGADEAAAEFVTDKARLARVWKKNDAGLLNAYALDGKKYASGKAFADDAMGHSLVDASAFIDMDAKAQRAELLGMVELPFDLAEIDAQRQSYFEGRTDVNREVKALTARLAGMAALDSTVPDFEVSASTVLAQHAEAREHNADIERAVNNLADLETLQEKATADVARLTDALDAARTYLNGADASYADQLAAFRAGPELINLEAITAQLEGIEGTNAKVREQTARAILATSLAMQTDKETKLTAQLAAIDKQKLDGLKAAKFPVEGLGIDDDGITYKGIPFKQVNDGQQIEIACDWLTRQDSEIKLVTVKKGDALDDETLARIDKQAQERGYLVLTARGRDNSSAIGFTISAGKLV
jgi:ABC-type cobalamin/Fe3+-siderophores transport system ATPase subunit